MDGVALPPFRRSATAMSKVSLTVVTEPSVAVSLTFKLPTSPMSGVPEKVPVAALKLSKVGRAAPMARVAV